MAKYKDVLGALRDYRNDLEQGMHMQSVKFFENDNFFAAPSPTIHATGVGIRIKEGKVLKDDFVLKVFIFEDSDWPEALRNLNKRYKGIDIDIQKLPVQNAYGKKNIHNRGVSALSATGLNTTITDHRSAQNPILGGVSISPEKERYVGTLGCFLQRITPEGTREVYALSNNHVLVDTNSLKKGTRIMHPGPEMGLAAPPIPFADMTDFIPIDFPSGRATPVNNQYDAAIALVRDEFLIKANSILGISSFVPSVAVAIPGMKVIKAGRTTGVTTGTVFATRMNGVQVNYGMPIAPRITSYNDVIQIVGDDGKPFGLPGDSGSVILEQETSQPVALLFAGDTVNTWACDLGGVCKHFQAFPF